MAEYKGIKGFQVQTRTEDPSEGIAGDFYYNSTSGEFKTITDGGAPVGTWSSGGNLPGNRTMAGSFGTQTATIAAGGTPYTADSYSYNGVAWSEIAEINTERNQSAGLGVSTSGLIAGGYNDPSGSNVDNVENWNGSAWTEVADLSSTRAAAGSAGIYTAGLVFSGTVPGLTAVNESWNGSSWSEEADVNTARYRTMGQSVGTQTAAMLIGGDPGGNNVETWDGSSWTEVAELNTSRYLGGGNGITTAAIAVSGRLTPPNAVSALVEAWDGSSWTEINDVSTGRGYASATGTGSGNPNTQSLFFGGATTGSTANTTATEEFSADEFVIKTVTTS